MLQRYAAMNWPIYALPGLCADTQEEAAAAYDRAAVRNRGMKAITNFDISNYIKTIPKAHKTDSTASESPTSSATPSMSS